MDLQHLSIGAGPVRDGLLGRVTTQTWGPHHKHRSLLHYRNRRAVPFQTPLLSGHLARPQPDDMDTGSDDNPRVALKRDKFREAQ